VEARLAELLGALSLATDLAAGAPLETSLRTCVLATRLSRALGWSAAEIAEARRVAILRHLGCTAYAHEAARIAGDDQALLATFADVDRGRRGATVARTVARLGRGTGFGRRMAILGRAIANPRAGGALIAAQCGQAVGLAEDLGMPAGVVEALGQIYERHDGRGGPRRLAGDTIRPSARVLHLAELVETCHRMYGRDAMLAEVKRRRGKHVAAEICDVYLAEHDALRDVLEAPSVWDQYLDADDADPPELELERVAAAFGRFADLKSPFMLGHSAAVADLAAAATDGDSARIRVAALIHDLGVVSVPNAIWDKPGPLNASEWERVRLHGYHTQRILSQSPALAEVAAIAGAHHERLDGSGYHRNAAAAMLDRDARVLAACDAYESMRAARPHRAAMTGDAAAAALAEDAAAGRLCRRAVDAVLGAVGAPRRARVLPAGLTPREVEVLVELARGRTNKEIASSLGIAVRTANHHVENIYGKIGVTTRAAAALFAVRHDLVHDGESSP
jgi:HD-GYP domain-containing protein (c-di-GMP phosphodiesterase class II)